VDTGTWLIVRGQYWPGTPEATARGKVPRGSCGATRPGACRRWRGKCRGLWRSGWGFRPWRAVPGPRRACRRSSGSDQIRVIGPSVLVRVLSGIGAHVASACQDPLRTRRCPGVCYASFAGSAGRHSQRTAVAGMPRQ